MKRISLLFIVVACSNYAIGQLSGIKTIPGDYATIAAAVTDLNAQGVGSGGVTFNVNAGHIENISAPILVTATGTSTAPVEFRKSGTGANPSITRTDAGSITTGSLGGDGDAIIRLSGTDYFTWRQINLNAGNQGIEYGFMAHKPDGTNGSQYVNVLNSVITLTKGTSAFVTGIYISNGPVSSGSSTGVTVTIATGKNSMITIAGNTIQNVHSGILCLGSVSNVYPDESFTVGAYLNGNDILNFGGGNTATAYGIYFSRITHPEAYSNDIDNQAAHAGSYTGIYFTSAKGHVAASYNTFVVNNSSTNASTISGIYCSSVVTSNTFEWNIFSANAISSTGSFYWIRTAGNTEFSNISNNSNYGSSSKASGQMYCIYMNGPSSEECSDYIGYNTFGNITLNGGATSSLTGIFYIISGNASQSCEIDANYLSPLTNNGSGATYGINAQAGSSYQIVSNNTIAVVSGAGNVTGINYSSLTPNVYNNTIRNLTSAGTDVIAINDGGTGTGRCYKNNIYNLTSTHSTPLVRGINAGSSHISHIYNNYISDLKAPNANKSLALAGIYISSGYAVNVYYNTIFLNAVSSGALFGSAGIYQSSGSAKLDLRNNNIVNISTPNGALGYTIAFYLDNYQSIYSELSNCNNFYAGTPGPNRLIFRSFSNLMQTLDAYKNLVSTRDGASISENPPFVNIATAPYNLHLQTGVPTRCEKGGRPVTSPVSVTNDFDANVRNFNFPDIGADEFSGLALDQVPPAISFTPLKHTASTGNRTLQTTITDPSGVPVSGSGLPMLYWRVNAGAYTGVQAVHISGNRYDFTFGGGVTINNVVQYFVVAHDQSATPNIGSKPYGGSGFSANPPACSTPPANPYSYTIKDGIGGIVYVGDFGNYSSLTDNFGLFKAINNKVVTANITAIISSDLTETGDIWLNQWLEDGAGNYTLTIVPDTSVTRHVAGSSLSFEDIIVFFGADRVIVDGRYNGSGNYLTFSNNSSELVNSVFRIFSQGYSAGSNDITIRNCNIQAANIATNTSYGIYSEGEDNDNLSIIDNVITRAGHGVKIIGYTPNGGIDDLLIQGNSIGSMSGNTVWYRGISISGALGPVINNNEIVNINMDFIAETNAGIELGQNVTGALISNNRVHGLRSVNNGGQGTYGIYISTTNSKYITISNNLIYDLITDGGGSSTTNNPFGIRVTGGSGIQIYHNSIHLGGSFLNLSASHISSALFFLNNPTGLDIRNNILANTMTGAAGIQRFAVYSSSATYSTIDHNDYFGTPLAYNGSTVNTLAEWQLYTGQDINSIAADPLFTGPELQLSNPSSPAIGNASPVGITTDFSGSPRHPVFPAMGAREYNPTNAWIGNSPAWNAASNWGRNQVPDDSYQVIIPASPAGGNFPVVPAGVFECQSLYLENGSSLSIQGQLEVKNVSP